MDFHRLSQNMPESVLVTNAKGNIEFVNPAFTKVTGYLPEEVIGQNPRILKSGRQDPHFYQTMWEAIAKDNHWQGEIWNRRKNGEVYPEWLSISAVRNEKNEIINYVGLFTDITLQKISENTLQHLAHHDSLTGLPNRTLFFDRLNQSIALANRGRVQLNVLYIDLDRFKPVNDQLGHAYGDLLLKKVASRIQKCIRKEDTLARLGGDEFAIVLMNVPNSQNTEKIVGKILQELSIPFPLKPGFPTQISASIGIATYPIDGKTAHTLLDTADRAMYEAKKSELAFKGRYSRLKSLNV